MLSSFKDLDLSQLAHTGLESINCNRENMEENYTILTCTHHVVGEEWRRCLSIGERGGCVHGELCCSSGPAGVYLSRMLEITFAHQSIVLCFPVYRPLRYYIVNSGVLLLKDEILVKEFFFHLMKLVASKSIMKLLNWYSH
jgi:hypothetical protein